MWSGATRIPAAANPGQSIVCGMHGALGNFARALPLCGADAWDRSIHFCVFTPSTHHFPSHTVSPRRLQIYCWILLISVWRRPFAMYISIFSAALRAAWLFSTLDLVATNENPCCGRLVAWIYWWAKTVNGSSRHGGHVSW